MKPIPPRPFFRLWLHVERIDRHTGTEHDVGEPRDVGDFLSEEDAYRFVDAIEVYARRTGREAGAR